MKLLGFYITRTDWETIYDCMSKQIHEQYNRICELEDKVSKQSETYTGKDGRLRFKHNGQFAPDNRSKFKRTHDRLRAEVNHKQACDAYEKPVQWDKVKQL